MKIILSALTLTLIFTVGASGLLVTVANAAAPGSAFYSIDRGIEDLQMQLTANPQTAYNLESKFAIERLQEVQTLLNEGQTQYLDQAIAAAGLTLSNLEDSANLGLTVSPEYIDTLVNVAFQIQAPEDENENENVNENENENENTNENENVNENENGNENSNENGNENANENGNENANENGNENLNANEHVTFKQPKSGAACGGGGGSGANQPAGEKLAAEFGVDYGDVIGWFCRGYGFGEISLAYLLAQKAGVDVATIFDLRGTGVGWGNIMKQYNLKGVKGKNNPNNPFYTVPSTTITNPTINPSSTTKTNPGKGNGKGNGKSNGKGNSKGKP